MDDVTSTGEQPDTDTMPAVPVAEAARILNVTPDAIRARLRRGTLLGGKRGSEWFVQLPTDADPSDQQNTSRDTDTTQQDVTERRPDALLEQLRSENEYLRDQLSQTIRQLAAERERADVLHREALGRIEALTATVADRQDATGTPTEATESPERAGEAAHISRRCPHVHR